MVMFSIVATMSVALLLRIGSVNRNASQRTTATNLANEQIESIRNTAAGNIPDGGISRVVTEGSTTYTIRQTANYLSANSNVSICSGSGSALAYKLVTVTVRWPNMGVTKPVRVDTLKTLGIGADVVDSAKGALALSIMGARGAPSDGVIVTLTPGGIVRTTGEDGCAVYAGLAPGTYVATVNMPGWTAQQNTQAVSVGSLGVTAGQVARGTVLYDKASVAKLTPDVPTGFTLATGIRFMYSSAYFTGRAIPTCGSVAAGQGCIAADGTVSTLFPTVFDVWLGTCSDARVPRSLDAESTPSASVLDTGLAQVSAVDGAGVPQAGRQLYAVHAPETVTGAGTACSTGESYALPITASSSGLTGTRVALPLGTWTFQTTPTYSVTAPVGSATVTLTAGAPSDVSVAVP